jgi:hypothetical protein
VTRGQTIALALDPTRILRALGLTADPWQRDLLLARERQILLNCSRQSGKSTTVAALALHTVLCHPSSLVLLLSPSQRQSGELFRKVLDGYHALGEPVFAVRETQDVLELEDGSRVLALPSREETLRGFSGAQLLVIDEAARVPDALYYSVRPMLAVSRGRLVCLSTPFGRRGFFWREWQGAGPWRRTCITSRDCPRITPEFIAEERRSMGDSWVRQEYECSFEALEGLVYPDFASCLVSTWPDPQGRRVGGIDFGWRNPFAALWGVLDRDDVLWIAGERYGREIPLHEHRDFLKKNAPGVTWYADPAGRTEIEELRAASLTVLRGANEIRPGIAAVAARLRTGRLKVHASACPNLIAEASLYRYPSANERATLGEDPVDEHNHALGALRYLIARLDVRFLARLRGVTRASGGSNAPGETNHRGVHVPRSP